MMVCVVFDSIMRRMNIVANGFTLYWVKTLECVLSWEIIIKLKVAYLAKFASPMFSNSKMCLQPVDEHPRSDAQCFKKLVLKRVFLEISPL